MPLQIRPDDPRISWQGAISFEQTDRWTMPWRIPYEDRALYPPDALRERASMPAGVRISFHSDTQTVAGEIEPVEEPSQIDLYCDGRLHGMIDLAGQRRFEF